MQATNDKKEKVVQLISSLITLKRLSHGFCDRHIQADRGVPTDKLNNHGNR